MPGVAQFSNPQLAIIQSATDSILTAMTAIQTATNNLGTIQADVSATKAIVGLDLVPFFKELSVGAQTQNVWNTVLSIAGKGVLYTALAKHSQMQFGSTRITLDGVVVYQGIDTSTLVSGVCQEVDVLTGTQVRSPGLTSLVGITPPVTYPYVAGGAFSVFLTGGLTFDTSCLVEVMTSAGTTPTAKVTVAGGVYA